MALREVTPDRSEMITLAAILDSLGHHPQAEPTSVSLNRVLAYAAALRQGED